VTALDRLLRVLPAGRASVAHADRLACSTDLWPRHFLADAPPLPPAVVWPESTEEVSAALAAASKLGIAMTPYGAGSSVVGGATPGDAVVLDLKRMHRLLQVDGDGRMAHADAGIIGELLERQLSRAGFSQGHFPSSIYTSTLGGWIAARSAGQASSRYGKIEDQVVGGTFVCGSGEVRTLAPDPRASWQLDPWIGAEGTLGVWTRAWVRIHPLPTLRQFRSLQFPDLESALDAARSWLEAGLAPSVVRIYDPMDTLLQRLSHGHRERRDRGPNRLAAITARAPRLVGWAADAIASGCRAILCFEGDPEWSGQEMREALRIADGFAGVDLGQSSAEQWFHNRYALAYGQSNAFRAGVAVDTMEVACPWAQVGPVYRAVRAAGRNEGAHVLAHFSHCYVEGTSIYFTFAFPMRAGPQGYRRLWDACLRAACDAGANVSHHHGVGQHKSHILGKGVSAAVTALRAGCDPQGILNPAVLRSEGSAQRRTAENPCYEVHSDTESLRAFAAGSLWRHNYILNISEPRAVGFDGRIGADNLWFCPAPRAATGPGLAQPPPGAEVHRVWLRRNQALAWAHVREGRPAAILRLAKALVQHEAATAWRIRAHSGGQLEISGSHARTEAFALRVLGDLGGRDMAVADTYDVPELPHAFAATWASLLKLRHRFALDVLDPVGGIGRATKPAALPWSVTAPTPHSEQGPGPAEDTPWQPPLLRLTLPADRAALDNCTYCPKLCRFSCPVAEGTETLTPRQLMRTAAGELSGDVAARLWACVDCGGCGSYCAHGNDVAGTLGRARAELWSRHAVPPLLEQCLRGLYESGHLPGAEGDLAVSLEPEGDRGAETLLFLGCQNTDADADAARALLALARRRFGPTQVVAGPLACCGQPLWRWGARTEFAAYAAAFAAQLRGRRVIVDDPGCAAAIRSAGLEVLTAAQLLGGRVAAPEGATVHQPCQDPVLLRPLVDGALPGSVLEGSAGCCGGMLLPLYDARMAQRVAESSARDILGAGATAVLSTSPTCRRRLRAAGVDVRAPWPLWLTEGALLP
jgi:alkyldihydroxyacetonephosphate synthase